MAGDTCSLPAMKCFYSELYKSYLFLEQTSNLSVLIYIDLLSSRNLRKTWHGHDLTGQSYDKSCTCGNLQITNGYFKVCRCTKFCLIICQAVLGLSYTDRTISKSKCSQLFCLFLCICSQNNFLTTVDLGNDSFSFSSIVVPSSS